jgi:hypothetical protein
MILHVLVSLLMFVVLFPLFGAMVVAWKELKSPSPQQHARVRERSRDETKPRVAPQRVLRNVN